MKTPFAASILLVGLVGCGGSDSVEPTATPTKPAATSTKPVVTTANKPVAADNPVAGEADSTFSLSVPFESVALTQGEEKELLIGINRGENFGEQVAIEVTGLPAGVTVETADSVITQGSKGLTIMLKASPDAALGDFTAEVTGKTASSGADFSKELKITVSQE